MQSTLSEIQPCGGPPPAYLDYGREIDDIDDRIVGLILDCGGDLTHPDVAGVVAEARERLVWMLCCDNTQSAADKEADRVIETSIRQAVALVRASPEIAAMDHASAHRRRVVRGKAVWEAPAALVLEMDMARRGRGPEKL